MDTCDPVSAAAMTSLVSLHVCPPETGAASHPGLPAPLAKAYLADRLRLLLPLGWRKRCPSTPHMQPGTGESCSLQVLISLDTQNERAEKPWPQHRCPVSLWLVSQPLWCLGDGADQKPISCVEFKSSLFLYMLHTCGCEHVHGSTCACVYACLCL